ncbi:MAG: hypothetical protein AB7S93_08965 [Xanthobacteraceae bacterium]
MQPTVLLWEGITRNPSSSADVEAYRFLLVLVSALCPHEGIVEKTSQQVAVGMDAGRVGASFLITAGNHPAGAQQYPNKTITAISPFGPGTSLEAAARPVFEWMSRDLGQAIVVEHRPV